MAWNIGPYEYNSQDIGVWQNEYIPVVDFGPYCHITFVNRRVSFYNNQIGTVFIWDFGDGTGSEKLEPKHTYKKAGVYTVTLTVDGTLFTALNQVIVFENSFILDSGAVYLNYGEENQLLFGATEGGNRFGIENEIRYMTFDNVVNLIGSHRIVGSTPKIIANMIEINYRLLSIALPGSDISFNSGSTTITRAIKRLIESNYIKNIAIVAEHGGTGCYLVFKILNAITLENIEIPFEDSNESVIELTFAGCFTPDDIDYEPWEIDSIIVQ